MKNGKEDKTDIQKKKVNKLKPKELVEIKDLLESCDQRNSRKYKHVVDKIERINNDSI